MAIYNTLKTTLLTTALAITTTTMAQQSQDSLQYGGWNKYRIGGYSRTTAPTDSMATPRAIPRNTATP